MHCSRKTNSNSHQEQLDRKQIQAYAIVICNHNFKLFRKNVIKLQNTHLRGNAKTRWAKVTKLVSWLDMNHAKDETLHEDIQQTCKQLSEQTTHANHHKKVNKEEASQTFR